MTFARRVVLVAVALVAGILAPGAVDRAAAAPETADWFPLQGSFIVWCTANNPSPYNNCGGYHSYDAMDIGVPGTGGLPIDTPVYAAGPGVVIDANGGCSGTTADGCGSGAGNFVAIQHPDGRVSRYLHLDKILVAKNDGVVRGQKIGLSGNSGSSTSPHLHYDEQQPYGTPVDIGPMKALVAGAVVSYPDYAGYTTWYGPSGTPYGTTIRNDGYLKKAVPGDFDGTNRANRATYDRATGAWQVPGRADVTFGGPGAVPVAGDYDGNGTVEPATFDPASGAWKVTGASDVVLGGPGTVPVPGDWTGSGVWRRGVYDPAAGTWTIEGQAPIAFGGAGLEPVPADYDGDGSLDAATFDATTGAWHVRGAADVVLGGPGQLPVPADYNGDGKAERATYEPATGTWRVEGQATVVAGGPGQLPVPADCNGDGKADRATYNPVTGVWKVPGMADVVAGGPGRVPVAAARAWGIWRRATAAALPADLDGSGRAARGTYRSRTGEWQAPGVTTVTFGTAGDVPLTGDLDGNGRAERLVYRPAVGLWFVNSPSWWPFQLVAPVEGDVPVLADFRGDGRVHPSVFRPGTGEWFVEHDAAVVLTPPQVGDIPLVADTDGSGRMRPAVFRPSTGQWFLGSSTPVVLGQAGDLPVAADLDLDGRTDPTVFRPTTGQWLTTAAGAGPVTFGQAGDIPVAVDGGGSARPDLAVYRPATGEWLVRNGATIAGGQVGDVPVPRSAGVSPLRATAPASVVAAAGNGSAVVSFSPPAAPPGAGGSAVLAYTVTASPGGATATVGPTATSAVVVGLVGGTPYTFTVAAATPAGPGLPSPATPAVVPSAAPSSTYHALTPFRVLDTRDGTGGLPGPFGPAQTRTLTVTGTGGPGGVPASGVSAVVLNVTVTGPTQASHLAVWPADRPQPTSSNLNFVAGETVPNLVIATVSADGRINIFNNAGSTQVIADVLGWFDDGAPAPSPGADLVPVTPFRVLDTRDGTGGLSGRFGPAQIRTLTVTGTGGPGGVPASGVSAVVLNVTVTGPTQASHLAVWPADRPQPTASNLNFVAGETVPNLVIATVSADGRINIFNNAGSVDVIADVMGYFSTTGASYVALTPSRVLDTRDGTGGTTGPLAGASSVAVRLGGLGGVPPSGVRAVVLNVTATQPSGPSFLTLWPHGLTRPTTSNLNFVAGQTVPNLVVVPVSADGTIDIYNNAGTVQVVADVIGWFG